MDLVARQCPALVRVEGVEALKERLDVVAADVADGDEQANDELASVDLPVAALVCPRREGGGRSIADRALSGREVSHGGYRAPP